MRVAVCIPTCNRPQLLAKLLAGLSELAFEKMPQPEIRVIVVDNDPAGTASHVCSSSELKWPLKYVIEPVKGISQARNRALREVEPTEFVAFLDDDEVPDSMWLDELLWTQAEYDADAVSGPVAPAFTASVPKWIKAGRFFDRPIYPIGHRLKWCASGNVLVSPILLARVPEFDEAFGLSGGEDLHFFLRASQAGLKIVSCPYALVSEFISEDRANGRWLLQRSFRSGNSWVFAETDSDSRLATRLARFVKGSAHISAGVVTVLPSLCWGRASFIHALQKIYCGLGMLSGLARWRYQEYKLAGHTRPLNKVRRAKAP